MFKKYFIPHKNNDHQPHILRKRAVLVILVITLFIEGFFLVQIFILFPNTNLFSSILPNVLIDLTNYDRQQNSVQPLKTNSLLEKAAQLKADDMVANNYFAHTSPTGIKPWDWLDKVGYNYQAAGENLAINFLDSNDIDNAWMNSAGHRANILNNNFTEIGIAIAKGLYNGKETIFVVQFFGKPELSSGRPQAVTANSTLAKTPEPAPKAPAPTKPEQISPAPVESEQLMPQETFIFKEIKKEPAVSGAQMPGLDSQIEKQPAQSSLFKRIFSMPRSAINFIYFAILTIVLAALFLKVFVKIKIQYPRLIFNGIILLFVIISIIYLNYIIIEPGSIF